MHGEGKAGEGGTGLGGGSGIRGGMSLEDRLASIENQLSYIQPFIEQSLRPDLSQGALQGESDYTGE